MTTGPLLSLLQAGRSHNPQLVSHEHLFRWDVVNPARVGLIGTFAFLLLRYSYRLHRRLFEPNPLLLSPFSE